MPKRMQLTGAALVTLLLILTGCVRTTSPWLENCDPPVGKIRFGAVQPPAVEQELKAIFTADQAPRLKGPDIDWTALNAEDAKRRAEVMRYLAEGTVVSGQSQFYAAMVFQHGNCTEHIELAHQLAKKSMAQGYSPAKWLYAATLDRLLVRRGKPQKYGTQYRLVGQKWELLPVDPATTDEERAKYNVPSLSQAQARAQTMPVPSANR